MRAFTHHHTLPYTPHTPLHTAHSPTHHTPPYTPHTPLHTTHFLHTTHIYTAHTPTQHTHTHTHHTLPTHRTLPTHHTLPTHRTLPTHHTCYMLPPHSLHIASAARDISTCYRAAQYLVARGLHSRPPSLPPTAHLPVPVQWAVDGSPARTRTATCRRSRTGTARATATQPLKSPPTIAAAAAAWVDAPSRLRRPSYLSFPYVYVK